MDPLGTHFRFFLAFEEVLEVMWMSGLGSREGGRKGKKYEGADRGGLEEGERGKVGSEKGGKTD